MRSKRSVKNGGPQRRAGIRGRPRQIEQTERREKLIEAAEQIFVETGYGAANVDEIARRAGMSKKTIYQIFDTKESLFAAVIAARRAVLASMIDAEPCNAHDSPENVLRHFLSEVARFVLAPRQAALYRLVIAESQRAPELAHAFYREGPTKARTALTQWLALQHERNVLYVPDAASAAGMLFSMVIAEPQMCLLIGESREPSEEAIRERVEHAVGIFLNGARARGDDRVHGAAEKKMGRIQERGWRPVPAK
jgi:AcrR family transcriptional regulator